LKKKTLAGALTVLALTIGPALGAEAKGPKSGKGKGKAERHALSQGKSKRCGKSKRVGFQLRGTLAPIAEDGSLVGADGAITLNVVKANRHARRWLEDNEATFQTAGVRLAFVGVTDANAPAGIGLEDALATDRVKVQGKLALPKRGCESGETALTTEPNPALKRIKVVRPEPEDGEETETEQEEPSTLPSA
jgi:hypothetical protein